MSALDLTRNGLIAALTPIPGYRRDAVIVNGEEVGTFGPTTYAKPSMAWSWRVLSTYGFASDRDDAILQIKAAVLAGWPAHVAGKRIDAERVAAYEAELAALPASRRVLRQRVEEARFGLELERHRSTFSAAGLDAAQRALAEAERELASAEAQREAA